MPYIQRNIEEDLLNYLKTASTPFAACAGSSIKLSTIVNTSSPGYRKINDLLRMMELWHQVITVPYESLTLTKTGTITPKRFLFDHGVRFLQHKERFLGLDLLDSQTPFREEIGGVLEHFVLTELLSRGIHPKVWAKTHQSGEVDFFFETEKNVFGLEVKASSIFKKNFATSLLTFREYFPKSQQVITYTGSGVSVSDSGVGCHVISVYQLSKFLKGQL